MGTVAAAVVSGVVSGIVGSGSVTGAVTSAATSVVVGSAASPPASSVLPEVLSLPQAMRDYPQVTISAEAAALVGNGRLLDRARAGFEGGGPWAVLGPDGDLLAMYEERDAIEAKPSVVLAQ